MKCFIKSCKNTADPKTQICSLHMIMWANSPQSQSVTDGDIDYSKGWEAFTTSLEDTEHAPEDK